MKRLAMPATWPLAKKQTVWITQPLPSGHPKQYCMPINIILRDLLKLTKTTHETKKLLVNNDVFVDGRKIKNYKEAVGLFDILEIPGTQKAYTFIITKKNLLKLIEIKQTSEKIVRIKAKKVVKGNKIQLTFHDGRNFIADNKFKVGDSVIFDFKEKKIKQHLPLSQNAIVYVIAGSNVGKVGIFKGQVKDEKQKRKFGIVEFKDEEKKEKKVLLKNLFVIDENWEKIIEENNN